MRSYFILQYNVAHFSLKICFSVENITFGSNFVSEFISKSVFFGYFFHLFSSWFFRVLIILREIEVKLRMLQWAEASWGGPVIYHLWCYFSHQFVTIAIFSRHLPQYLKVSDKQLDFEIVHLRTFIHASCPRLSIRMNRKKWITAFKFRFCEIIWLFFCLQSTTFDCIIGAYVTAHWKTSLEF